MYKLIGKNNLDNILDTTLENRGVEELEQFKQPNISQELHFSNLKDMEKAVKILKENTTNEILIVTDRDLDGQTSSAILHNYLEEYTDAKVSNIQHSKRENGLTSVIMDKIINDYKDVKLVILPDSSTNDIEQHHQLNELGISVIVLDHHGVYNEIKTTQKTAIVNPLLSESYPNKKLSGVGVTYRFLQALDKEFGVKGADKDLDLVAFGNIGDSMDLRELDTRSIVFRGLKKIKNKFFKELIKKYTVKGDVVTPSLLSWKVFPKLNALIRIGNDKELEFIYRAIRGEEGKFENKRARSKKNRWESLEQKAVRLCNNAYGRQRTKRDNLKKEVIQHVDNLKLSHLPIIIAPMPETFNAEGLVGYVAGNLTNHYERPVVLTSYSKNSNSFKGSLRGVDYLMKNTKSFLESSGKLKGYGHENACGVEIKKEDLKELMVFINDSLVLSDEIEVDFKIEFEDLNPSLIREVDGLGEYWGSNVNPPKFVIKNVKIPMKNYYTSDTINKVNVSGIELASFSLPKEIRELAGEDKYILVDIIGELSVNRWYNFRQRKVIETEQVMIEAFELRRIEEDGFLAEFLF